LEKRLQERFVKIVKAHMKASTRTAHGPRALPEVGEAASACQATWRFLNNERVTLQALAEPLRKVGREGCCHSRSSFVLLAHDWCKLDYASHASKEDLLQLTHKTDIGYDLTTALLIEAHTGITLAPMQLHLKTGKAVHSTAKKPPKMTDHHLDQLEPTMDEAEDWGLERKVVHVIDREADALGRFRSWDAKGHLFLVRCDDRRVRWNGQSILLSEINEHFHEACEFQDVGKAKFHGKSVRREVAEASVVLYRQHKETRDGKQVLVSGKAIEVRAVFVRLVDKKGYIIAEWMLLTNVPADQADAAEIGKWYYWRWRIESFFKLLKSDGHEIEYWQQTRGKAIARRLLIAAMACVVVHRLQGSESPAAAKFRKYLVQLSGRQMKYGRESTGPALLAGYFVLLSMTQFLAQNEVSLDELEELADESFQAVSV
jgi:hypothetical protein